MSARICPFNQQPCGCDPNAEKESARPCKRSKRAAKFVRLLGSSVEGEQLSALRRLGEFLQSEGLTFNDLGTAVQDKQYTVDEARLIYAQGKKKGLVEEARKQQETEYFDIDGQPQWYEIAIFCQENSNSGKLSEWEREFVSDMPSKMIRFGQPTEKQGRCLLGIFIKLGGRYDRKASHVFS